MGIQNENCGRRNSAPAILTASSQPEGRTENGKGPAKASGKVGGASLSVNDTAVGGGKNDEVKADKFQKILKKKKRANAVELPPVTKGSRLRRIDKKIEESYTKNVDLLNDFVFGKLMFINAAIKLEKYRMDKKNSFASRAAVMIPESACYAAACFTFIPAMAIGVVGWGVCVGAAIVMGTRAGLREPPIGSQV